MEVNQGRKDCKNVRKETSFRPGSIRPLSVRASVGLASAAGVGLGVFQWGKQVQLAELLRGVNQYFSVVDWSDAVKEWYRTTSVVRPALQSGVRKVISPVFLHGHYDAT